MFMAVQVNKNASELRKELSRKLYKRLLYGEKFIVVLSMNLGRLFSSPWMFLLNN